MVSVICIKGCYLSCLFHIFHIRRVIIRWCEVGDSARSCIVFVKTLVSEGRHPGLHAEFQLTVVHGPALSSLEVGHHVMLHLLFLRLTCTEIVLLATDLFVAVLGEWILVKVC